MRRFVLFALTTLLSVTGFGQSTESSRRTSRAKPVIYSASSDWQKVTFRPTAPIRPQTPPPATTPTSHTGTSPEVSSIPNQPDAGVSSSEPISRPSRTASGSYNPGFRPAFTGDFATNRNGWKAGNKGDYHYQIGMGRYSIRKRNINSQQVAFSYVPLPADINLNLADTFTVKVDVLADSGRIPTGGLLFGVRDSLNFCAFTLDGTGRISIIRAANGATFSDYMPGDFFTPGVPVDKNRNRLTIRRKGDALHFYVNEQEVRSSPYPYKMFSGNGIGMTTSAYWTSFQKLSVTLGP